MWTFKHPTVGDAYATIVAEDPELLDIYMSWTSADKLIAEVTCGEVELEGVKVIVPESRYEAFLDRLPEVGNKHGLHSFLATRCSRAFLEIYLARHAELGDEISEPGSYLSAVSEVDVLERLHELEILPEAWRVRFVKHAKTLAVETPDVDFLSVPRIRALFRQNEIAEILEVIHEELLPSFSDVVSDWRFNCDSDKDPDEEFAPLVEVVETLRGEFEGNSNAEALLASAQQEIEEAIQTWREEQPLDEDLDYRHEGSGRSSEPTERSVFEDVDS